MRTLWRQHGGACPGRAEPRVFGVFQLHPAKRIERGTKLGWGGVNWVSFAGLLLNLPYYVEITGKCRFLINNHR